jgi:hypothetical protein
MLIGELAARSGLSVRTLRFYADAGLVPEAGRTAAGYRVFEADAVRSPDTTELELMTDLATLTADERRRIVEDYLDAVFGDDPNAVADKMRMGVPELTDDPTPDQFAAWAEVAQLLTDPEFLDASRRMAERARAEGPEPDVAQFQVGKAVGELAGAAMRSGVDPASPEAEQIVEAIEAIGSASGEPRTAVADRIEAFTDRRVARYWTLVGW